MRPGASADGSKTNDYDDVFILASDDSRVIIDPIQDPQAPCSKSLLAAFAAFAAFAASLRCILAYFATFSSRMYSEIVS